jgi:protein-tyrosine-phosphatase/tRNA A37 threonylcarbamoyladenosine synthetase subunit TsaC/SUA5/YrdC
MPEFVDWTGARDRAALAQAAVETLARGEWVALPTESGFAAVARADRHDSSTSLPAADLRWSLALPGGIEPETWTGKIGRVPLRLLRRTWPGPVCYVFEDAARSGPAARLAPRVRELVAPGGHLALRQPSHDAFLALLDAVEEPLLLAEPPNPAPDWLASLGEAVALVLEAGPARFQEPATRVRIAGDTWRIEAPGVYDEDELRRLTACLILFVCTGNTCRSPMAEALCKAMLAARLDCAVEELPQRGWWVMSAGVSAFPGDVPAPEAQQAVRTLGANLGEHQSRPVRPELAAVADYLLAMTRSHQVALRQLFPELGAEPRLLGGEEDLPDPIGGDQAVYDNCARLIQDRLECLLAEVMS